jgi:endonuclease/exonuclease/phosphatase family metal-dependent hydrolase
MRLASYNVENLFERPAIMNLPEWSDGRAILEEYARLTKLLESPTYTASIKEKILNSAGVLGIKKTNKSRWVELKEIRQKLLRRPPGKPVEVIARGRDDWIGWVELVKDTVDAAQIANTARVMRDVNADVIAVVEAEHRTGLQAFNAQAMGAIAAAPYDHVMLIDGNDDRGIDVALMSRAAYPIEHIRSHVDDRDGNSKIFSRDCPEYCISLPGGKRLWVLVNHLKSKGYGAQAANDARRKKQAQRVRQIYDELAARGEKLIAVVGDMNDTPGSDALSPLLADGQLKDTFALPQFNDPDGRPGTHGSCTAGGKIDYILLSPALVAKVQGAGVWRRGMWGGKNGTLWPHYPEVKGPKDVASDHAALWVDLAI